MILCLGCKRISPEGSKYCGHCSRSLGCRICVGGHTNRMSVDCCTTCGSSQLSLPARVLHLSWLTMLLTVAVGLVLLRLLYQLRCLIVNAALSVSQGVVAFVLGTTSARLTDVLTSVLAFGAYLFLIGHLLKLLPGEGGMIGEALRGLPIAVGRFASAQAIRGGKWLWKTFWHILFGATSAKGKGEK